MKNVCLFITQGTFSTHHHSLFHVARRNTQVSNDDIINYWRVLANTLLSVLYLGLDFSISFPIAIGSLSDKNQRDNNNIVLPELPETNKLDFNKRTSSS